jgi:mannosyltransferase
MREFDTALACGARCSARCAVTILEFGSVAVVAPSLHWRYSGVTSTIIALVPRQARDAPIAALGPNLPADVPRVRLSDVLLRGWSPPAGFSHRIWHARRNTDMLAGVLLKSVLRQPWKLVFTSAGQRRHTAYTRWLIRRMDALIATSEGAAAYLEQSTTLIPHGVDTGRFHPAEDRGAEWGAAGLPGSFGVGAFGRIRPQKGADLLVEAMIRLLPKYPDAALVLTGLVAPQFETFKAELEARVAAAGLQSRVLFLGERPVEEMPEWFRRVAVYVAPMRQESFGLTPLEAMASGAAVVATRTGAAPALVEDGETGFLVEPNNLEALTNAIERLLADRDLAAAMGLRGRAKAVREHDIEGEARCINAVYRTLWAAP